MPPLPSVINQQHDTASSGVQTIEKSRTHVLIVGDVMSEACYEVAILKSEVEVEITVRAELGLQRRERTRFSWLAEGRYRATTMLDNGTSTPNMSRNHC